MDKAALVVTTIHPPNRMMAAFADGCRAHGLRFIVTGDEPTPSDYRVEGCDYYGLARQSKLPFDSARACPTRSVARKNIAYLLAMQEGAKRIVETDDDNLPYDTFWETRPSQQEVPAILDGGWINAYGYFTDALVWPRGLPLDEIRPKAAPPAWELLNTARVTCPVQAGLADEDPDVDAIYRLTQPLPQRFRRDRRLALLSGTWFPFNSQNTTWWSEAHPLMYLPSTCSFRVADIWRSFVVQRVLWTNGWGILHHEPTLWQERSPHDLLRDFEAEIPGYLNNRSICATLEGLTLKTGVVHLGDNLRACYESLVAKAFLASEELTRLEAWLSDVRHLAPA